MEPVSDILASAIELALQPLCAPKKTEAEEVEEAKLLYGASDEAQKLKRLDEALRHLDATKPSIPTDLKLNPRSQTERHIPIQKSE